MNKAEIEKLLGVPPDAPRQIPGTNPPPGRELRYVQYSGPDTFSKFFERLMHHAPIVATHGGVMTGGCKLVLPSGDTYQAISYKGDLEGWRAHVQIGVAALEVLLAQVVDGKLVLADGSQVPLTECQATFG